ncbi:MAG: TRAP transporter small permease [Deltaproteobacteria bacterium]|nr:TRAP transporter small permease [Deltaproteobacteria bacterium]
MKNVLGNWVERVCMILVVALAIIVFLQVFNRFILKAPLAWSEDLAMLLFQWVAFLGAAVGVKRTRHFGIELVVKRMSAGTRHWIEIAVIPLVVGAVAVVMIVQGYSVIQFNLNRVYSSMDLSYIWAYLPIPISGILIVIFLIEQEVQRLRGQKTERG